MQVFDLSTMEAFPHEQREKNVFCQTPEFKARIIVLGPGGGMPACHMSHIVVFYVVRGQVTVTVDSDSATLGEGQCLVTDPATVSMRSEDGARLIGFQIVPSPDQQS